MTTVSARDASRGLSSLLDRVERDGDEYTIVRDGKPVARIVPVSRRTVGDFLARRRDHPPVDDDFEADAVGASRLLVTDSEAPWRD